MSEKDGDQKSKDSKKMVGRRGKRKGSTQGCGARMTVRQVQGMACMHMQLTGQCDHMVQKFISLRITCRLIYLPLCKYRKRIVLIDTTKIQLYIIVVSYSC